MHSIRQALQNHELIVLRVIGEWWDIDLTGMKKEQCVQTLADSLPLLDVPQELIYLPHKEAEAIRALVQGNGRLQAASFRRQFGQIREMGPGALERDEPWYEPQSAAEDLWYRGLIYKGVDKTDEGIVEFFYLPDQFLQQFEPADFQPQDKSQLDSENLLEIEAPKRPPPPPVISGQPAFGKAIDLASFATPSISIPQGDLSPPSPATPTSSTSTLVKPASMADPPHTAPPERFTPAQTDAVDDMTTLLSLAQAGQLRVGHADLLAPYMQEKSLDRLELLTTLAVELKFLRQVDEGLYRPTRAAVGWLQNGREHQLRTLGDAWRTTAWNELRHMPTIACEGSGWQNDPISARTALFEVLKATTDWFTFPSLTTLVKQNNPDFQRPNGNYDAWYIRDTLSGTYLRGFDHWEQVEGRLLTYLITTPMCWLGLADTAENHYRLTSRALAWLSQEPAPAETKSVKNAQIIITDDAHLTLSQHVDRYKRFQASRVAKMMPLRSEQPPNDVAYHYRLTPETLSAAKENGIAPDRVIDFLTEASGAPLPATTQRAITRWQEKGTEGRLEQMIILRVASADILTTLRQHAKTRPYLGESLGELSVMVLAHQWASLCSAAAQLGLLLEPPSEEKD